MSALPPKADIGTQPLNVRFVPEADITSGLIDYFISAAFDITGLFQALVKPSQAVFHRPRVSGIENSDDGYRWLLRVSRERPRCRRPAQKFGELAPPH
jgi:hypothetical protein